MDSLDVASREVRLPERAVEALSLRKPVAVTRYGRRQYVVLHEAQFDLIAPLLELLEQGAAISPELQMTTEDLELERDLADDREPSEAEELQIRALVIEADASRSG